MFLNMVLCKPTTMCSCQTPCSWQTPQQGKGVGAKGGEGTDLRLISFPSRTFKVAATATYQNLYLLGKMFILLSPFKLLLWVYCIVQKKYQLFFFLRKIKKVINFKILARKVDQSPHIGIPILTHTLEASKQEGKEKKRLFLSPRPQRSPTNPNTKRSMLTLYTVHHAVLVTIVLLF